MAEDLVQETFLRAYRKWHQFEGRSKDLKEQLEQIEQQGGAAKISGAGAVAGEAAGLVLALNSVWTLAPVAAALIVTIIRTTLEDRTLQEELPGYKEYATQKTKYRLIPGIW